MVCGTWHLVVVSKGMLLVWQMCGLVKEDCFFYTADVADDKRKRGDEVLNMKLKLRKVMKDVEEKDKKIAGMEKKVVQLQGKLDGCARDMAIGVDMDDEFEVMQRVGVFVFVWSFICRCYVRKCNTLTEFEGNFVFDRFLRWRVFHDGMSWFVLSCHLLINVVCCVEIGAGN